MTLIAIDNAPVPYPWGSQGGISALLGRTPTGEVEAELWLGSHPRSPSRVTDPDSQWTDLRHWEESSGQQLPFLLKILDAAAPLSLQAHPTAQQAKRGYQREEASGVPLDAGHRSYRDPWPKPEMIVALADGFEALCGFREPDEVLAMVRRVGTELERDGLASPEMSRLEEILGAGGIRATVGWLLSGTPETIGLIAELESAAPRFPAELSLVPRLLADFPRDPGVVVALLLNYEVLAAGEALWLPAGTIHAYLSGTGMELMGPSDNVLRGGLTSKHIDVEELLAVLDTTPGPAVRLSPVTCEPGARSYRTAKGPEGQGADFELLEITAGTAVTTAGPSLVAVLEGDFAVTSPGPGEEASRSAGRGDFLFHPAGGRLTFEGRGRAFLATPRR
ncbi:mannose-6-phosphate isomerase, class I [Nesterenkonia muleiensis]|uniref:mannose-6-phosphate isomerase, class I n=1 Tax=Nesterenkonia muleiensis TaxID=2282648 RepID=UPI000E75C125|nr:mannose-6-phosphate isomerase, class I [Nesterenkonia muleiensis]